MVNKKNELKKLLLEKEKESELLKIELEEAASHATHRICRYRSCKNVFATDDDRIRYCCREHYFAENRERTIERNALRKKSIDT